MRQHCKVHGYYDDSSVRMCPHCVTFKALRRLNDACGRHVEIEWHHDRYPLRCVDIYNYRAVRELIPEQYGRTVDGKRFIILYDDPQRFHPIIKPYCPDELTDFEDQLHKDEAKMKYAHDYEHSVLRISFTSFESIEHHVNRFIHSILHSDTPIVMCSDPSLYDTLQQQSQYYLRDERKWYFSARL